MWKLKIAEGANSWLRTLNNHVGRQVWEFDPKLGSLEELMEIERAGEAFYNNRFEKTHSSDLLMRMQVLGVYKWYGNNPLPPEIWLFPYMLPFHPGLVLMEHLKSQVKDSSLIPDVVKSSEFLDCCNLLKCDHGAVTTIEELSTNVGVDLQELWRRPRNSKRKKQKLKTEV